MSDDKHWSDLVKRANAARKVLDEKPRHLRIGYSLEPGSILNAYREGDATFGEAVEAILETQRPLRQTLAAALAVLRGCAVDLDYPELEQQVATWEALLR